MHRSVHRIPRVLYSRTPNWWGGCTMTIEVKNSKGEVIFTYPNGEDKDFDGADLRGVNLSGGILDGADFSDANLEGCSLQDADCYWATFFRVRLREANLRGGVFCGADLKLADLTGADLRGANFGQDNVDGSTQLQGAILTDALTENAKFTGAEYDSDTRFPKGFDPSKHAMRLVSKE